MEEAGPARVLVVGQAERQGVAVEQAVGLLVEEQQRAAGLAMAWQAVSHNSHKMLIRQYSRVRSLDNLCLPPVGEPGRFPVLEFRAERQLNGDRSRNYHKIQRQVEQRYYSLGRY